MTLNTDRGYYVLLPQPHLPELLLLWELCGHLGLLNPLFFPVPSLIVVAFFTMLADGEIQANLSITLFRVFAGFLIGTIPGITIGLVMGASEKIRLLLDPVVAATYPIPKLAIFPLLMIIFGIGELSKVMAIAIGCFFLVLINSMAGVRNINKGYFEVAKNYGANNRHLFTRVILPGEPSHGFYRHPACSGNIIDCCCGCGVCLGKLWHRCPDLECLADIRDRKTLCRDIPVCSPRDPFYPGS